MRLRDPFIGAFNPPSGDLLEGEITMFVRVDAQARLILDVRYPFSWSTSGPSLDFHVAANSMYLPLI